MTSPLTNADSLRIGSVDFVSPDEIKVLLDIEAPNDVALNTGFPPRTWDGSGRDIFFHIPG